MNSAASPSLQPRPEHPQPQWERKQWINLNGEWEFEMDDQRTGDLHRLYARKQPLSGRIQVPYCYQSKLSGIADTNFHDLVWYRKSFTLPAEWSSKQVLLHFGAVDYKADVWVNGQHVISHEGGHTPFFANITHSLQDGENIITVRAEDFSKDNALPRGKQYWKEKSESIFYTGTTGIWQTVWLEAVSNVHMEKTKFTPDIDRNEVQYRLYVNGLDSLAATHKVEACFTISFKGKVVTEHKIRVNHREEWGSIGLNNEYNNRGTDYHWSPENPNLLDVSLQLLVDGQVIDEVASYFGMRKISIQHGKLCLNNHPYTMRLVLDQGYFPDGLLTAPDDADFIKDIELTKAMGFNGVRKHQKTEDPRYLYWADRMGLLVWGEAANAYQYTTTYVNRFMREWQEIVERDYNHPCIAVWVPLNESWGIPLVQTDKCQQHHGLAMYHMTKSFDPSRPVIYNDGWEMMNTDIVGIHDYEWKEQVLTERYATVESTIESTPAMKPVFVGGAEYEGQPILVTEFGGIKFKKSDWDGWGYSGAENDEDFKARLQAVIRPLYRSSVVQGFCYTQLTDVEQEINGLLTYDREPKLPLKVIHQIVTGQDL